MLNWRSVVAGCCVERVRHIWRLRAANNFAQSAGVVGNGRVAFLCTGCTVLSGAMDGKERFGSVSFGHSKEMNSTKSKAFKYL
ncbi:MAG: hypothetical protein V7784_02165 [Oceanospirillaceae bacterium]